MPRNLHLKIHSINNPSNIKDYINPDSPYVIISQEPDCDMPDIRICKKYDDVVKAYNEMKEYDDPIHIEEIINHKDYGHDIIDYVVSCLKGIEYDSVPIKCEVVWENIDYPDNSVRFTTNLKYGIDMK